MTRSPDRGGSTKPLFHGDAVLSTVFRGFSCTTYTLFSIWCYQQPEAQTALSLPSILGLTTGAREAPHFFNP